VAGHSPLGGPLELHPLVRRDTAGAGSCRTGNFSCTWDGDRLRGEGRQRWEADPERKASEFMPGIMESCWRRRGKRWGLCLGRAILKAEKNADCQVDTGEGISHWPGELEEMVQNRFEAAKSDGIPREDELWTQEFGPEG